MPACDVELGVEYYPEYTLSDIPAGWKVKVNGVEVPPDNGEVTIPENANVEIIPSAGDESNVKSVKLVDD